MNDSRALAMPVETAPEAKPTPAPAAHAERKAEPPSGTPTEEALEQSEMPLPTDPKTIFLGGLFGLAVITACSFAQAIIVPVVMATFLKLLLQPLVKALVRLRVPRPLAALAGMFLL